MKKEKNFNENYIPTIEEMQKIYEENLRKEASETAKQDSISKIQDQGMFFNKFRKFKKDNEIQEVNIYRENNYYKKYEKYKKEELKKVEEKIEEIENLINYENFFLKWERKVGNNFTSFGSNEATRYRVDQIKKYEEELQNLIKNSQEAYEFYYKRQLLRDIKSQNQNKLVDVSYVKDAKEKVINSMEKGKPVYIVGHLGSGKTQLASEASIEFTIKNKIQKELEKELENWYLENQNATEEDAIYKFKELFNQKTKYYENILETGEKEEVEKLHPLFISGSHNLTYEDMFVEKTLTLAHSFSQGSYSDYLELIIDDFYVWMDEHKDKLEKMTEEEQLNLKIQIWKSFSDLLVASNSAFGTEIKKIEREILIAVRQGRPVIVDELNTIAMQNLIALNDILQRNIGHRAYITGVGAVKIEEGFAFIGTGNLSTQMVNYEGTNELNPAFKSRFLTIEYNYVLQNTVGTLEEQENPQKNELFRIIVSRLIDEKGNIHLPDVKNTLEELFRFAQLSRVTQNVFMGKWKDNETSNNIEGVELRESVLSIRNILHVLDNWNLGEEKDLSKALWDSFISSITYPDDQNYILSQAVRFGFFSQEEGWNIKTKSIGDSTTTYDEIRTKPYEYNRPKISTLSYLDIIYMLYGKPKNTNKIPEKLKEIFKEDIYSNLRIDINKYEKLDQELSKLEHSINLIEYLEEEENKNGN